MQKNTPKLKMQQQLLHVVPHRSPIVQWMIEFEIVIFVLAWSVSGIEEKWKYRITYVDSPNAGLVDRRVTLWTSLSRNHPHGVTTFEAGRAATTRNLGRDQHNYPENRSTQSSPKALTGMAVMPSASNIQGTASLSMGICWHMLIKV
jgi:hypothetical protein